ncbi:Uncharacterised protein [Mycobacteroides abscessus subsp. abscessus]|nr:Uncharacterised protein [Mycobacteroides abscessus subsp. abscessus]
MVPSALAAGGLAGNFRNGTTYSTRNRPPATASANARGLRLPTRPIATT